MKLKRPFFILFTLLSNLIINAQTPVDTTLTLQNVTVQGRRFGGISGGEIKRLEVESNLSSVAGNTAAALGQLPSLTTDIEGGVVYRGSGRAAILLNGVPYGLLEEYNGDVLIQLPALFFRQISLTAFEAIGSIPDGDAGVLNLLPASATTSDSPLQVSVGAGLQERYNAGIGVNLHPGRFHIAAKYNYRREYRERSFQKSTVTPTGTTEMDNSASARPNVHVADLSIGYDLTEKDRLTVYGLYHLMQYDRYGGIKNKRTNPAGETVNNIIRHRFNRQQQDAYAAEARWTHQFDSPQEQLEVTFNYNHFAYDENNDYRNEKAETGATLAQDRLFVDHSKRNYYATANYRKTFAGGYHFEGGYTARFKNETYIADASDLKGDAWLLNNNKSTDYDFKRHTQMLFASLGKQFGQFSTEVGVQGEYRTQKIAGERHSGFRLYPRLKATWQATPTDGLSLSYIQRVNRPYGTDLNPFTDFSDATYIKQGNPDLKDEKVHAVELTYHFVKPRFRLSPSLYYRNRQARIMDVAHELDEQTVWRKENIGHTQTVGFELSAGLSPINPLSISLAANVYRDEIDGRQIGYDEKKSLVCCDIKGNVSFSLTPTTTLQADGFYISDQLTAQGKIKSRFSINAGISQQLLHQKLRINLSIQDIFDSLEETVIVNTNAAQMRQVRKRDPRVAWVTFTYSL